VRATAASEAALEESARAVFGEAPPLGPEPFRVSAGTCVLEGRVATPRRADDLARELLLPPRIEAGGPLPDLLNEWLAAQQRPVVYVSFGSMVSPRERVLRRLARGLARAQVAVLWAQPAQQRASLRDAGLPTERFRFEEFVPQAALLASGRVACFVTHAGAASVQEALSAGVPMLTVPFVWDQPYMASVVERLGCGKRLRHRRLAPRTVEAAVRAILVDRSYSERARSLAAELRRMPEESVLPADLVEALLAPR
jgi:UDP:flavonoid glycosyltransferase YjiC (YdhE family)